MVWVGELGRNTYVHTYIYTHIYIYAQKVLSMVILPRQDTRALTFENLYQSQRDSGGCERDTRLDADGTHAQKSSLQ